MVVCLKPLNYYTHFLFKGLETLMCEQNRKEYHKSYYLRNKEKIDKQQKDYDIKNKEKRTEYLKEYKQKNKDKIKKYNDENKEKRKKYLKEYRDKNKEFIRLKNKEYYENNKSYICYRQKKWYNLNRDHVIHGVKRYYKNNKFKIQSRQLLYEKYRLLNDPIYRLIRLIRSRLRSAVKHHKIVKQSSTLVMLGCDSENLMEWLQQSGEMFDPNFNIYDYDSKQYHIDHKKTFADVIKGIYTLEEVCHYTNLQILPADINLSKGGNSW